MININEGELIEVILYVQDMNAQVAFYHDQLRLRIEEPEGIKDFRDFYRVKLRAGGCSLVLTPGRRQQQEESSPRLVFHATDIYASRKYLWEQGVEIGEVHSLAPGMFVCEGKDPEGNAFALECIDDSPYASGQVMAIPPAGMAPTYVSVNSRRGQSILLLRDNKILIAAEIILVIALQIASVFFGLFQFISFFLIIMALLWLRGNTWTKLGLKTPRSWKNTILSGVAFGVLFYLLQSFVISPIIIHLVQQSPNLRVFNPVKGNIHNYIVQLISTWTSAAFIEEMIYRGYLLNRIADLFGATFPGWTFALFAQAIIFGAAHAYQGLPGMIATGAYGLLLGLLYLGSRRNLWRGIIAHGIIDTIAFSFIFSGW